MAETGTSRVQPAVSPRRVASARQRIKAMLSLREELTEDNARFLRCVDWETELTDQQMDEVWRIWHDLYPEEPDRPEEIDSPFAMLGAKTLPDRRVEEDKRKGLARHG